MVKVTLAAAKAKVTSIRAPRIPRIELQANLVGAQLVDFILLEHRETIDRMVFWSDSKKPRSIGLDTTNRVTLRTLRIN